VNAIRPNNSRDYHGRGGNTRRPLPNPPEFRRNFFPTNQPRGNFNNYRGQGYRGIGRGRGNANTYHNRPMNNNQPVFNRQQTRGHPNRYQQPRANFSGHNWYNNFQGPNQAFLPNQFQAPPQMPNPAQPLQFTNPSPMYQKPCIICNNPSHDVRSCTSLFKQIASEKNLLGGQPM